MISTPELKQGTGSARRPPRRRPRCSRPSCSAEHRRPCARWTRAALTDAAVGGGVRAVGHGRRPGPAAPARRRLRPGRTGARAAPRRLQQRRDPLAEDPGAAGAGERGRIREGRFAHATATSPTRSCGSIRAPTCRRACWATTRDALYGWTAERLVEKADRRRPAGLPLFLRPRLSGRGLAGLHGFHASELPYVFGTFGGTPPLWPKIPATPQESKLSDAMIGYWTSFASSGRPRAANAPDWPAFGSQSRVYGLRGRRRGRPSTCCRACTSCTKRPFAGAGRPARCRGTGTSACTRRSCRRKKRVVRSDVRGGVAAFCLAAGGAG